MDKPISGTYAVIFSAHRRRVDRATHADDDDGYGEMAHKMSELARTMPGYIDHIWAHDSDGFGITISYWESEEAIVNWKNQMDHCEARRQGREKWYTDYQIRVARIERAYDWKTEEETQDVTK